MAIYGRYLRGGRRLVRSLRADSADAAAILGGVHRLEENLASLMNFGPSEQERFRLASIIADLDRLCLASPEVGTTFQEYCRNKSSAGLRTQLSAGPARVVTVLIAQAAPDGLLGLRQAHELSAIETCLGSSDVARFDLHYCHAARSSELRRSIRKLAPSIFHFSGHGSSDSHLILHGEEQEAVGQAATELVDVFGQAMIDLRLAFFNACWTESQALAICTVSACAIGIREQWSDTSAVTFAQEFYLKLSTGSSIGASFGSAREAISAVSASDAMMPELWSARDVDPDSVYPWDDVTHA